MSDYMLLLEALNRAGLPVPQPGMLLGSPLICSFLDSIGNTKIVMGNVTSVTLVKEVLSLYLSASKIDGQAIDYLQFTEKGWVIVFEDPSAFSSARLPVKIIRKIVS